MVQKKTRGLVTASLVAALYVVLTYVASLFGLSSGVIQLRLSEALNVLAVYTFSAVPGIAVGCLLANLLTGCVVWDVLFGSLASLVGALGVYALRKHRMLALLMPVLSNTLVVPLVLKYAYGAPDAYPFLLVTVALGELASCGALGMLAGKLFDKYKKALAFLFG